MERLTGGAKRQAVLDPLPHVPGMARRGPKRMIQWIQLFVTIIKGFGVGESMTMHPFQLKIVRALCDPKVRTLLVSIARSNGKTGLAAAIAVFYLIDPRDDPPEVLIVSSTEQTAEIMLDNCRRIVAAHPELAARVIPYKDKLVCPGNGGVLKTLPTSESALHGYAPTLLILDELHMVDEKIWSACVTSAGKRPNSKVLAISTPAATREAFMYRLTQHGRIGVDPSFRLIEFAADDGCDLDDEKQWRKANPAIAAGFLDVEGIRSVRHTTPPGRFRQLRLGQWSDSQGSWVTWDEWQRLADDRMVEDGARVVLGWDGAVRNDASVLMGATVPESSDDAVHLFVIGVWARDKLNPEWEVPRDEVDDVVRDTMRRYRVEALCADPYFWQSELQRWHAEFGNVVEWNTNTPQRMARATDKLFAAIKSGTVTHDGDETLALHVSNATTRSTPHGDILVKHSKNSDRKIDALIAACIAHDHAVVLGNTPEPLPQLGGLIAL